MKLTVLFAALALPLSAGMAFAQAESPFPQGETQPAPRPPVSAGPGVNVFRTLNPVPPNNRVTQTNTYADYAAQPGFQNGAFIVVPIVTAAAFYDDYVFALTSNRRSDTAFVLRPEIAIRSNGWANGRLLPLKPPLFPAVEARYSL